jgi:hypothetical protein
VATLVWQPEVVKARVTRVHTPGAVDRSKKRTNGRELREARDYFFKLIRALHDG